MTTLPATFIEADLSKTERRYPRVNGPGSRRELARESNIVAARGSISALTVTGSPEQPLTPKGDKILQLAPTMNVVGTMPQSQPTSLAPQRPNSISKLIRKGTGSSIGNIKASMTTHVLHRAVFQKGKNTSSTFRFPVTQLRQPTSSALVILGLARRLPMKYPSRWPTRALDSTRSIKARNDLELHQILPPNRVSRFSKH